MLPLNQLQSKTPKATGLGCLNRNKKVCQVDVRWVTFAFLYRKAIGRTKRSIFTGFLVKPSPTNVALVTIRFQDLLLLFPVFMTLNISSSAIPLTLGSGTAYFAALSFLFCLMALESAFASFCPSRSSRYVGSAASGVVDGPACLTLRSSCALSVFLSCTFSACRFA